MALEDFADSEVGIAVAATALVLSPKVRGWLRQGAVYGLAGVLKAADSIGGAARNVAGEAQHTATAGADAAQQTVTEARTVARGNKSTGPAPEK